MVRPVGFRYNEQTASNNYYQTKAEGLSSTDIQEKALREFDQFVNALRQRDLQVVVVEDSSQNDTPDAIFPNNWVSFHQDGRVGLFPMFAENRRKERRKDILETLEQSYHFRISGIADFTEFEKSGQFLEATGSVVLDRQNKIAYAGLSQRTDTIVLEEFCGRFDYQPVTFTAFQTTDQGRVPIYHTNVMMSVGEQFAVLCAEAIDDKQELENVIAALEGTDKEVIYISEEQLNQFAGNMLEVKTEGGDKYLVMSTSAFRSLKESQTSRIRRYCEILHSPLDTIEAAGGGSARCMIAEVFLPKSA